MAELTVSVAKAIAEGQGATAWEIYQLARAFLHEHGMESPPYVEHAALSHAAGQDGEQCRAESGFDLVAAMESWHSALDSAKELSANAPDERYRTRASDVVAYLMTRAPNADSALSRGVPEGRQVLPEGWRVSIERGIPGVMWLELNGPKCSTSAQARKQDDVQWRIYERFEAAIAAQQPILGVTGGTDEGWGDET